LKRRKSLRINKLAKKDSLSENVKGLFKLPKRDNSKLIALGETSRQWTKRFFKRRKAESEVRDKPLLQEVHL